MRCLVVWAIRLSCPVRVVVVRQVDLQLLPALSCWLASFNVQAHHVVDVALFKTEIVLNQLSPVCASSFENDVVQGFIEPLANLFFELQHLAPPINNQDLSVDRLLQLVLKLLVHKKQVELDLVAVDF